MRKGVAFVSVVLAAAALAAPALGASPTIVRDVQITNVLSDPTACGDFGVRWNINITADILTFFDREGRRVRQVIHIKEDNTVTRLATDGTATGPTLREGPDSFTQTTYFNPDGTVDRIVATGLAARVGNDLRDVGRVVLVPLGGGRTEIVFGAGPHPVREAADLGTLQDALPAFCDVLR